MYIQQKRLLMRERILKLLTATEAASVTRAETSERLAFGDEYLDLNHLDRGVRRAGRMIAPMGRVLARKAVPESTWLKLTEHLAALTRATLN